MDRILDIDLDFFLDKISESRENGRRLNKEKYIPWGKTTLVSFLENRCFLSTQHPLKGRTIKNHHQAFFFWRELILTNKIEIPFEVVHLDAHSDIGVADWSWIYVTSELLHKPLDERIFPDESLLKGINEGNYLVFALACRWIKKLTFVIHPKWKNDLIEVYFKDFDFQSNSIQLKKFNAKELFEKSFDIEPSSMEMEPEIPVEFIPLLDYKNKHPFTVITLSHSKEYTPRTSDKLIKVMKQYFKKI
ncbi:MAG: peptide arginase family protein [Promethearchaeota archaeon]|jgi:hypothetical protein